MRNIIAQLADICKKHQAEEKILVVPSYIIGRQIGKMLARRGVAWSNLRFYTVQGIAHNLINQYMASEGVRFISNDFSVMLVEDICEKFLSSGRSRYFDALLAAPGMHRAIARAVEELRLAGYSAKDISPSCFESSAKSSEIQYIFDQYEKVLEKNRWIDKPGVLRVALSHLSKGQIQSDTSAKYFLMSDFPLTECESQLLKSLTAGNIRVLEHVRPVGLEYPLRFASFPASNETLRPTNDAERMFWLFHPEDVPPAFNDGRVTIYAARGEINEIREIFRILARKGVSCDRAEIVVSDIARYTPLIWEACARLGIPATFADGIPISYGRPARALMFYLQWLQEDFAVSALCEGLSAEVLGFRDKAGEFLNSTRKYSRILRRASIGWGRGRYFPRLEVLAREQQSRLSANGQQSGDDHDIRFLIARIAELFSCIPDVSESGVVDFRAFCRGVRAFLKNFAVAGDDFDRRVKEQLDDAVAEFESFPGREVTLESAVRRMANLVEDKRITRSASRSGHIHVSGYRSGGYSSREYTFVIGLDSSRFPGRNKEDSILSDDDRYKLKKRFVSSRQISNEKIYTMTRLLANVSGHVFASYSCVDLLDNREMFPSRMLLQIYRLSSGDMDCDYSGMRSRLGGVKDFNTDVGGTLSTEEWWLARLTGANSGAARESVRKAFPHLKSGVIAEGERDQNVFTIYDGYVPSANDVYDPRKNLRPVSASRLEQFARCPFKYFLNYVLKINLPDEIKRDSEMWLDAFQYGSALHEIFCRFMREITARNERPDMEKHSPRLRQIGEAVIQEWLELVPPANRSGHERQRLNIIRTLDVFLELECEHSRSVSPTFFEVSFGMPINPGLAPSALDVENPVPVMLEDGQWFNLRGRIDRIDKSKSGQYEIWDYKTGRSDKYSAKKPLEGGKRLQHALYAIAAEYLLKKSVNKAAKVKGAGYYFPTEKGEGARIDMGRVPQSELSAALSDLCDMLGRGQFPAVPEAGKCEYCDFNCVCGSKFVGRMKRKIANEDEVLLSLWRGLKNYV